MTSEPVGHDTGGVAQRVRRWTVLAGLPLFAACYLWQALTVEVPGRQLVVSPRAFPTFVGVLMVLVTIALAVRELLSVRRQSAGTASGRAALHAGDPEDEVERISSWRDVWVVVGALVAYVVMFGPVGYPLSTFGVLTALSTYFARDKWRRNVLVALAFTVLTWYVFRYLLSVQLPAGVLSVEF